MFRKSDDSSIVNTTTTTTNNNDNDNDNVNIIVTGNNTLSFSILGSLFVGLSSLVYNRGFLY